VLGKRPAALCGAPCRRRFDHGDGLGSQNAPIASTTPRRHRRTLASVTICITPIWMGLGCRQRSTRSPCHRRAGIAAYGADVAEQEDERTGAPLRWSRRRAGRCPTWKQRPVDIFDRSGACDRQRDEDDDGRTNSNSPDEGARCFRPASCRADRPDVVPVVSTCGCCFLMSENVGPARTRRALVGGAQS
jgi:hypothetical protein